MIDLLFRAGRRGSFWEKGKCLDMKGSKYCSGIARYTCLDGAEAVKQVVLPEIASNPTAERNIQGFLATYGQTLTFVSTGIISK
jgi:hypothetical protein